ncbi:hypothetical protein TSUD_398280 [Trifolium subterraneum]|uniref:RNase H type-1 domain-containing protein n=1 Tax=Trifolium subterraneum TaxID=3900 RepID=A0A1B5Z7A8_TRISU|nr:hypothetical protein TSUD_398280 [Trifolium subterraneum]
MITTIIYGIWYARNQKIYQQKDIQIETNLMRSIQLLQDYQHNCNSLLAPPSVSSHLSSSSNNISWSPPPENCLKLNVDAHLRDAGHWGIGMILRRSDGRCVGAATKVIKGMKDANLAEATGLKTTLDLLSLRTRDRVIVEMDALGVVNAVTNRIFPRNQWGMVARSCARVLRDKREISVQWVGRKGNEAAHRLAR